MLTSKTATFHHGDVILTSGLSMLAEREKCAMRHGKTDEIYSSEAVSYSLASRELVWHKLPSAPPHGDSNLWGGPQSP